MDAVDDDAGADRSRSYLLPTFLAFTFLLLFDQVYFRAEEGTLLEDPKGSMIRQLVLGSLYLYAFLKIANRQDLVDEIWAKHKPLLAFVALAMISFAWSSMPVTTVKRSIHFGGLMLLFWCTLGARRPQARVVSFLRVLMPATLVASFVMIMVRPDLAIQAYDDAWAGIFRHKSEMAGAALYTTAFWLPVLNEPSYRRRALCISVLLFAAFMLVLADAKTELGGWLLMLFLWGIVRLPLEGPLKLALAPILPLLFALWFLNLWGGGIDAFLQGSIQRDTSLTERTPLWELVIENIKLHPWLGEGYQGFWVGGNERAEYILSVVQWSANHAHNGYLETMLSLGVVGLGVLLVALAHTITAAWRYFLAEPETGLSFLLILHWLLLSNMTQAGFCQGTSLNWTIFLLSSVMVVSGARERPAKSGAGSAVRQAA